MLNTQQNQSTQQTLQPQESQFNGQKTDEFNLPTFYSLTKMIQEEKDPQNTQEENDQNTDKGAAQDKFEQLRQQQESLKNEVVKQLDMIKFSDMFKNLDIGDSALQSSFEDPTTNDQIVPSFKEPRYPRQDYYKRNSSNNDNQSHLSDGKRNCQENTKNQEQQEDTTQVTLGSPNQTFQQDSGKHSTNKAQLLRQGADTTKNQHLSLKGESCLPSLNRFHSEVPSLSDFILSTKRNQNPQLGICNSHQCDSTQKIAQLTSELSQKDEQIRKLQDKINKITQSLAKIYSSPELLEKDIDDKELLKILSEGFLAQAKIHLAFLFSSPLIMNYYDEESQQLKSQTIVSIDHAQELHGVTESLRDTGNLIRYRKIPATLDNLRQTLTENPIALHFSGHGIQNNKANFGKNSALLKNEGNFLIFEDNEGCAKYLSEKSLHEMLEASGTKLEFVFVASCYSQFAGEIFHNAGAKHVICVKRGERISDEASILFSKHFYNALFSQTRTVCQAFALAKASLHAEKNKYIANESHKFIILKDTDELITAENQQTFTAMPTMNLRKAKKHKCSVFGPFMKGDIQNVGHEPIFKLEFSKVEDFLGRRKEQQDVISSVMNNRLVTIKGIPGIGKTTLAKAVAFYLDERNLFKDGIIFLTLRKIDQANMFLTRLYLILSKHIISSSNGQENHNSQEAGKGEDPSHLEMKIIDFLKNKTMLIILDNVEDPLRVEGCAFKEVIHNILMRCPHITLLLTSRIAFGSLADISEKLIMLKELTPNFALELLFKKAMRPIEQYEIQELMKSADPVRVWNFNPFRENKNSLKLEEHHILPLLGGHPHAISLAAPLLQEKSLKELYAMLNSYDIIDILGNDMIEGKQIAPLKMSLETSVEFMKSNDPEAMKFFCLIGLLPGGCSDEDLDQLWGPNWQRCSERLFRASLLVKKQQVSGENKYTLLPFMNKFAEQKMEDEDKIQFHLKCCRYFGDICKQLYKWNNNFKWSTTQNLNDVMNRLVQIETNIWACIYRMMDIKRNDNLLGGANSGSGNNYNYVDKNSLTRGKSPAPSILSTNNLLTLSEYTNNNNNHNILNFNKSNDGSSQEGDNASGAHNQKQFDDNYEKLLCRKLQEKSGRSYSQKNSQMRSLMDDEKADEDEESEANTNQQEQQQQVEEEEIQECCQEEQQQKRVSLRGSSKPNNSCLRQSHLNINCSSNNKDIDSDVADLEEKILCANVRKHRLKDNHNQMQYSQDDIIGGYYDRQSCRETIKCEELYKSQQNDYEYGANTDREGALQKVYPTQNMAIMLSDDHMSYSFNQSPNGKKNQKNKSMLASQFQSEEQKVMFDGQQVDTEESRTVDEIEYNQNDENNSPQNEEEIYQFMNTQNSEDNNSMSQSQTFSITKKVTKQNLLSLPDGNKFKRYGEDSNASSILGLGEQLETSFLDSIDLNFANQSSSLMINNSLNTSLALTCVPMSQKRRTSNLKGYSYMPENLQLENIQESIENENENSMCYDENVLQNTCYMEQTCDIEQEEEEEECKQQDLDPPILNTLDSFKNSAQTKPKLSLQKQESVLLKKKMSQKKYQEDEKFSEGIFNDNTRKKSFIESQQSKQQEIMAEYLPSMTTLKNQKEKANKKKKTVRYVFDNINNNSGNDNLNHQKSQIITISSLNDESKSAQKRIQAQSTQRLDKLNFTFLSSEGALLVYYISNLVLMYKYADAMKVIEQFGLKLNEDLCRANLLKLQGLIILRQEQQNIKEAYKLFEEASKLFVILDSQHGQAICNCAMGYILFTKTSLFVERNQVEDQVFSKALKKFEAAADQYQKIYHYFGEAFCHRQLSLIKQKMKKYHKNHQEQFQKLMKKDKELQNANKSLYIQRNQGGEVLSLFIEVVNFDYEQNAKEYNLELYQLQQNNEKKEQQQFNDAKNKLKVLRKQIMVQRPGSSMKKDDEKLNQQLSTNISNVKSSLKRKSYFHQQQENNNSSNKYLNVSSSQQQLISSRMQYKNEYEVQAQLFDTIQKRNKEKRILKQKKEELEEDKEEKSISIEKQRKSGQNRKPEVKKVYQKSVCKSQKDQAESKENNGGSISTNASNKTNQAQQAQPQQQLSSDTDINGTAAKVQKSKKKKTNLAEQATKQMQLYISKKKEQIGKAQQTQLSSSFLAPPTNLDQLVISPNAALTTISPALQNRRLAVVKKANARLTQESEQITSSQQQTSAQLSATQLNCSQVIKESIEKQAQQQLQSALQQQQQLASQTQSGVTIMQFFNANVQIQK